MTIRSPIIIKIKGWCTVVEQYLSISFSHKFGTLYNTNASRKPLPSSSPTSPVWNSGRLNGVRTSTEWKENHLLEFRQSLHHLLELLGVVVHFAIVANGLHREDDLGIDLREPIQDSLR